MTVYHLDTNVLIDLCGEKQSGDFFSGLLLKKGHRFETSVICILEFLSGAEAREEGWILDFIRARELAVVYFDSIELAKNTADIRKKTGLKTPDALVVATALSRSAILLTFDQELIKRARGVMLAQAPH